MSPDHSVSCLYQQANIGQGQKPPIGITQDIGSMANGHQAMA